MNYLKTKSLSPILLPLLIVCGLLLSPDFTFASMPPKGLEITEVMNDESNNLTWIEVKNNQTVDADISGFSITTNTKNYLYPENSSRRFIIPKSSFFIFTNDITKLIKTLNNENIVAIQIEDLSLVADNGKVEIRDSFDVLIDTFSYTNAKKSFASGYSIEKTIQDNKNTPSIEKNGTPGEAHNLEIKIKTDETLNQNQDSTMDFRMTNFSIQEVKRDSAVVTWTTAISTIGIVRFGENSEFLTNEVSEKEARLFHTIHLTNLKPNTKYYLQVTSKNNIKAETSNSIREFKTTNDNTSKESVAYSEQLFDEKNLSKYDSMDAMFLKIDTSLLEKKNELPKTETSNPSNLSNDSAITDSSSSFEGLGMAAILVLLFLSFFIAKYLLRLKNRLRYNLN